MKIAVFSLLSIVLLALFLMLAQREAKLSKEYNRKYNTYFSLTGEIIDYEGNLTKKMLQAKLDPQESNEGPKEVEVKYDRIEVLVFTPKEFEGRKLLIHSMFFERVPPFNFQRDEIVEFETTRGALGMNQNFMSISQFRNFKKLDSNKASERNAEHAPRAQHPSS